MPGQNRKQYKLGRADAGQDLRLPSGNVCLVKRPGPEGLIKAGLLDSLDTLTALVQTEHIDSNDPKAMARAVQTMAADKGKLIDAITLMDKVVCHVVLQPPVAMPPGDGERDPEALYVDEVDEEDKAFIFNFVVGGTRDIETFRKERAELMGGIPAVQDVQLPAK